MTVYAINAETLGISEYSLPAVDVVSVGDTCYALSATSLDALSGADDNGADIDSYIQLGRMHFGDPTVAKTVASVYVVGEASKGVVVSEDVEQEGAEYSQQHEEPPWLGDDNARRIKLGRGFESRYPGVTISNYNGGTFSIKSLSFELHTRRHRVSY